MSDDYKTKKKTHTIAIKRNIYIDLGWTEHFFFFLHSQNKEEQKIVNDAY